MLDDMPLLLRFLLIRHFIRFSPPLLLRHSAAFIALFFRAISALMPLTLRVFSPPRYISPSISPRYAEL